MAVYNAPDGFSFDNGTGLYFKQDRVTDEQGNNIRVVT